MVGFKFNLKSVLLLVLGGLVKEGLSKCSSNQLTACLKAHGLAANKIVERDNPEYSDLNFQFNLKKIINPLTYIKVSEAKDVQISVDCARELKISISPRSGGHSYENYSLKDDQTLVLDLTLMDQVKVVDPVNRIAEIGPGALLGRVYYELFFQGKFSIPAGSCPTVGISGHALGGGYGLSSRKHGLVADRIVELEMVDAAGDLIVVNKDQHADLFWAMRGAGSNNFGIVTKFKMSLFDASKDVMRVRLAFNFSQFNQAYNAWQLWCKSNPKNSVTSTMYANANDGIGITMIIQEDNEAAAMATFNEQISYFTAAQPKEVFKQFISYIEMVQIYSDLEGVVTDLISLRNVQRKSNPQSYFKAKSSYISDLLSASDIELFKSKFQQYPELFMVVDLQGGAIRNIAPDQSAFPHRYNTLYSIQAMAKSNDPNVFQQSLAHLNQMTSSLPFFQTGKAYFNYIDQDQPNPLYSYFGDNVNRLRQVKAKYDPMNVFSYALSIPKA